MADLTVTPAEIQPGSSAKIKSGTAGEAITQGKAVCLVSGAVKLADANLTTTAYNTVAGVSINSAQSGQPVSYVSEDTAFVWGTTAAPTPGKIYVLSNTAGGIMPIDDISTVASSTSRISVLAVGKASGGLYVKITNSGVASTS